MTELFNPDNTFFRQIRKICEIIEVSILWVICSIPLFTIGASTAGLYYAVVKSIRRDRSYPVKEFIRGFKSNFVKSTVLWFVLVVLALMFFIADLPILFSVLQSKQVTNLFFGILFLLKLIVLLSLGLYGIPVLTRFQLGFLKIMEMALVLSVLNFMHTLFIVLIFIVTVALLIFEPLLLVFLPALSCLCCSFTIERVLKKHTKVSLTEDTVRDTWYLE